ncbi:MAG: TIGR02281 family clan AA aspartic protease [Bauldia sp.]
MQQRFLAISAAIVFAAVALPYVLPGVVSSLTAEADLVANGPEEPRTVTIGADDKGHFATEAAIDGRTLAMVVDTGATKVVLSEKAARDLGIEPRPGDYIARVQTANGIIPAAPVSLGVLSVGNVAVQDVAAVVVKGDALELNLLGMSFLSRLTKFEAGDGQLVLVQ